jgi:hypothetical protein
VKKAKTESYDKDMRRAKVDDIELEIDAAT